MPCATARTDAHGIAPQPFSLSLLMVTDGGTVSYFMRDAGTGAMRT